MTTLLLSDFVCADNKIENSTVKGKVIQAERDINTTIIHNYISPKKLNKIDRNIDILLKNKKIEDVLKNNIVITGGTDDEIKAIKSALNGLNVVAATINITKSALDSNRNVNIRVTYRDNTVFSDSFYTPLDNVSNRIISLIDNGRIKK